MRHDEENALRGGRDDFPRGTRSAAGAFAGKKGQARPTVDANGILSEPCDAVVSDWPYVCNLGNSAGTYQPYLISKGIFERALHCSNHNLRDSIRLGQRGIQRQAAALRIPVGFPNANKPVIFATQVSVLDGLNAATTGSYAMC